MVDMRNGFPHAPYGRIQRRWNRNLDSPKTLVHVPCLSNVMIAMVWHLAATKCDSLNITLAMLFRVVLIPYY